MASKLLKPQGELAGKSKGDGGLKAEWAGSKGFGRNMTKIGDMDRPAGSGARDKASKFAKLSRDKTGSGPEQRKGYGAV